MLAGLEDVEVNVLNANASIDRIQNEPADGLSVTAKQGVEVIGRQFIQR